MQSAELAVVVPTYKERGNVAVDVCRSAGMPTMTGRRSLLAMSNARLIVSMVSAIFLIAR